MPQQDRHEGKTMLSRVWIGDSVAQQLSELAFASDHTVVEEIRVAVRAHVKRNRRVLKTSSNASWVLAEARADRIPHIRLGRYVRFDAVELLAWAGNGRHYGPRGGGQRGAS